MSAKNTIIVLTGVAGDEYVAKVGRTASITTVLDRAAVLSDEEARSVAAEINRPVVLRDLDEYRVAVGRRPEVAEKIERELQIAADS